MRVAEGGQPDRAKELAVQLVTILSVQKALGGHVRHTRSAEARRVEGMCPSSQEHVAEPAAVWDLAGQASLAAGVGRREWRSVREERVGVYHAKRT